MKNLLAIALFLCLASPLFAQYELPKRANTIIITDTLSQERLYNKITDLLFESGYGILNTNKEQGTITTTEKSYQNGGIKLVFLIKDKKILLRGDFKSDISIDFGGVTSQPSWETIDFRGMKGSAYMNAWLEMKKISDAIPFTKDYLIK